MLILGIVLVMALSLLVINLIVNANNKKGEHELSVENELVENENK